MNIQSSVAAYRLIPVGTGNAICNAYGNTMVSVNPRGHGERFCELSFSALLGG